MAHRYLPFSDSHSVVWSVSIFRLLCAGTITIGIRILEIGIVLAVNCKMRSRILYIYPPLKPFPSRASTKCRLPSFFIVHLTILELNSLSPNEFCDENSSSLTWAASTGTPIVSQAAIDLCVALRGGRCAVRDSLHLFVYYEDFIDEPRPDEDEVAKSVLYFTRKAFWSASKLLWERGSGKNCRTLSTPRSMAVEQMASGREKETGAHLSSEFSLGWFRKVLT